jgi:hypothetical protein
MYCPKCGTNTTIEQKFCRSCGINLSPVSEMLAGGELEPAPGSLPDSLINAPLTPATFYRSKMFRIGFLWTWVGLLLVILLGAGGDALMHISQSLGVVSNDLAGLAVVPLLLGAGLIAYSYFLAKAQSATTPPSAKQAFPRVKDTIGLPERGTAESVSSVTEQTTYPLNLKEKDVRE